MWNSLRDALRSAITLNEHAAPLTIVSDCIQVEVYIISFINQETRQEYCFFDYYTMYYVISNRMQNFMQNFNNINVDTGTQLQLDLSVLDFFSHRQ